MWYMWHESSYVYYDNAVSLTALSVQLHVRATKCMAKCVYPDIVVM